MLEYDSNYYISKKCDKTNFRRNAIFLASQWIVLAQTNPATKVCYSAVHSSSHGYRCCASNTFALGPDRVENTSQFGKNKNKKLSEWFFETIHRTVWEKKEILAKQKCKHRLKHLSNTNTHTNDGFVYFRTLTANFCCSLFFPRALVYKW